MIEINDFWSLYLKDLENLNDLFEVCFSENNEQITKEIKMLKSNYTMPLIRDKEYQSIVNIIANCKQEENLESEEESIAGAVSLKVNLYIIWYIKNNFIRS